MLVISVDGNPAFEDSTEPIDYVENEEYKAYRFIFSDTQYIFGVHDKNKLSQEEFFDQFCEVYADIINESTNEETKSYIGNYQDTVSQRAVAEIGLYDVNVLWIDIVWPSSASEYKEWIIYGKVKHKHY